MSTLKGVIASEHELGNTIAIRPACNFLGTTGRNSGLDFSMIYSFCHGQSELILIVF